MRGHKWGIIFSFIPILWCIGFFWRFGIDRVTEQALWVFLPFVCAMFFCIGKGIDIE